MHDIRLIGATLQHLFAVWLILVPVLGSAQTLERMASSGRINVGFVSNQPPFGFVSADQKPAGYAVELCIEVLAAIKAHPDLTQAKVRYEPVSVDEGLQRVESSEIDLLCGAVTETLEARRRVSFSIPIYVSGIGALVRKDAPPALLRVLNGEVSHTGPTWRATINAGLSNHTYAVHAGTTSESFVRDRIAALGVIAKVVTVRTYEAGIELIAQRKADAFFADRVTLASFASRSGTEGNLVMLERRFTLEPVGFVMQRGDEDFRLVVDAALSRLYRSGGYVPTYARYFSEPGATVRQLYEAFGLP